jgi:hypothetical protein
MKQLDNRSHAIFLFSQLSNINFGVYSANANGLQNNFNNVINIFESNDGFFKNNAIRQKINDYWNKNWKVVWGPCMKQSITEHSEKPRSSDGSYHADNSMYVAKADNTYIIAVAGTNMLSVYEKKEDIAVFSQKKWDSNNPAHGNIANGSSIGLNILMEDLKDSNGNTLLQFLEKDIPAHAPTEIITCGHSLGGGLCPLVALKIYENKMLNSGWNNVTVSSYPTAAPSIGDQDFVNYLTDNKFLNFVSLYNTNDIVPMAWEQDTFAQIPTAFSSFNVVPSNKIKNILTGLNIGLKKVKPAYKKFDEQFLISFEGTARNPTPQGEKAFMTEAGYQHIDQYFKEGFGLDDNFIGQYNQLLTNILPSDCFFDNQ